MDKGIADFDSSQQEDGQRKRFFSLFLGQVNMTSLQLQAVSKLSNSTPILGVEPTSSPAVIG